MPKSLAMAAVGVGAILLAIVLVGCSEEPSSTPSVAGTAPSPTVAAAPAPTSAPTPEPASAPEPAANQTTAPTAAPVPVPTNTSTPAPAATPRPEPTATPTAASVPTPTATQTPAPAGLSVAAYAQVCEAAVSEVAGDITVAEDEDFTWGDFAELLGSLEGAYDQINPPQEIQEYHDANLRAYEALLAHARSRPSEDSFIEEFLEVAFELIEVAFEIGFDTTKTDDEKERLIEEREQEIFGEFFGSDFAAAAQNVEEARQALPEETLALLDDSGCYPDIISGEEDQAETVQPAPTAQAIPTIQPAPTSIPSPERLSSPTTIAVPTPMAIATSTSVPVPTLTAASALESASTPTPTPASTPGLSYLTEEIPPCAPVHGSSVDPCDPDAPPFDMGMAAHYVPDLGDEPRSLREMFDDSPPPTWVTHLVVRGTYLPGTARCTAGDPFRLPSYLQDELGDFIANAHAFKCYMDVRANAYIVGSGPSTLTVMVFIWFYWDGDYTPYEGGDKTEQEIIEEIRQRFETDISNFFPGREEVLFIGPPADLSSETWRFMGAWDVQRREDGTVIAVHPNKDLWRRIRPNEYQTHISKLEMELPAFTQAVTTANQARVTEYGGRVGKDASLPMLLTNVNQLRRYYTEVGAYAHGSPTPVPPPPVYAPAPATLTATGSGEDTANLTWAAVSGISNYHVQHREDGETRWTTATESATGTAHSVAQLWCGKTHEFRVGARGDGTTYNSRAGLWSPTATATMDACTPHPSGSGRTPSP